MKSNCVDSGHAWEVVDQYQIDENNIKVVYECFECGLEQTFIASINGELETEKWL